MISACSQPKNKAIDSAIGIHMATVSSCPPAQNAIISFNHYEIIQNDNYGDIASSNIKSYTFYQNWPKSHQHMLSAKMIDMASTRIVFPNSSTFYMIWLHCKWNKFYIVSSIRVHIYRHTNISKMKIPWHTSIREVLVCFAGRRPATQMIILII